MNIRTSWWIIKSSIRTAKSGLDLRRSLYIFKNTESTENPLNTVRMRTLDWCLNVSRLV